MSPDGSEPARSDVAGSDFGFRGGLLGGEQGAGGEGREFGFDEERVDFSGSGCSLGHPVAASGARMVTTLACEPRRRGGGLGLATMCVGGTSEITRNVIAERILGLPHDPLVR